MYYALQGESFPVYETDEEGNILYYTDKDGNKYPMSTGEVQTGYGQPVEFKANINGKLHDIIIRAFGADNSSNYAQIVDQKGRLPFEIGTRIWRKSEVRFKDKAKTIVDGDSADYVVRGILDEGLNEDMFYLQKLNHEDVIINETEEGN